MKIFVVVGQCDASRIAAERAAEQETFCFTVLSLYCAVDDTVQVAVQVRRNVEVRRTVVQGPYAGHDALHRKGKVL